jgi:hypothetical protein
MAIRRKVPITNTLAAFGISQAVKDVSDRLSQLDGSVLLATSRE